MLTIDKAVLEDRYRLRDSLYLHERFSKSPGITERFSVSDNLYISYGQEDLSIIAMIEESFIIAHGYVKEWFSLSEDMIFDIWVAPEIADLSYMTCMELDDNFFCAPGEKDGMKIILFASPLQFKENITVDCFKGLLAHEITHHIVRELSGATLFTMKRREESDLPMWMEEGLCQFIQSQVDTGARDKWNGIVSDMEECYKPEDLWNDLSSCKNINKAYLHAYGWVRELARKSGKGEIFRLLELNRFRKIDWALFSRSVFINNT